MTGVSRGRSTVFFWGGREGPNNREDEYSEQFVERAWKAETLG